MILSMTGFGAGRAADARGEVRVALSAVNNRGWQLQLRSELGDIALEDELKTTLRTALIRGSVSAQITVFTPTSGTAATFDHAAVKASWLEFAQIAREIGAPLPGIEHVARLLPARSMPTAWGELARAAVSDSIAGLQSARAVEGAVLLSALNGHAAHLRELHGKMMQRAGERLPPYRDQLLKRLQEILTGQALVTPELLVRELAIYAERIDVTEEMVRLAAHLDALDGLLAGGSETGRKLDFLAQEIGREINTTGAKANDSALTALVLEAKLALDQIKEQAANVA